MKEKLDPKALKAWEEMEKQADQIRDLKEQVKSGKKKLTPDEERDIIVPALFSEGAV